MYLISVYPIIKGNWADELQYWSADQIAIGSIVKAPLRGKDIAALVFNCVPISEAKGAIKDAGFKTRKIEHPNPLDIVRPEFVKAGIRASTYFVQNIGSVLKSIIPACAFADILAEPAKQAKESKATKPQVDDAPVSLSEKIENEETEDEDADESKNIPASKIEAAEVDQSEKPSDITAISTNTEDRFSTYKSMIREELARKKSVLLISPTVRSCELLYDAIKKGIDHVTFILHGSLSKKKMDDIWKSVSSSERSAVIIATPQFMSIPRKDIETIIVENESSRAYKTFNTPFFDWRTIAEYYARGINAKLVYGDQLLSFETIHRVESMEIHEIFPLSYRIQKEAEILVIDMVESKRKTGDFHMLSEELASMVEYAVKKKQNMFIFSSRRGLSPQTVCGDCGKTVTCAHCQAPVVLHKSTKSENKGERYFLCHHCGKERGALEACVTCNSWKLITLGVGSDSLQTEIETLYPNTKVFRLDRDSAKNEKAALKIMQEFNAEQGAILIGTEMALSYVDHVRYAAIASMDSLFSIPDFRINERIAHILLRLCDIAEGYLLIQTRNADSAIIRALASKTLADFVKEEMELRQALNYPPYTLMGKVSLAGPTDIITKHAKKIESILQEYDPTIFPAMVPSAQGPVINILFTLPKDIWMEDARIKDPLYTKLKTVAAITPVHINPESFI